MFRRISNLIIILLVIAHVSPAWASRQENQSRLLATTIADFLEPDADHYLDIRCGEWTPSLKRELSAELLKRGFDLKETAGSRGVYDSEIAEGVLVQVDLNLEWKQVEEKNFFSYTSRRVPHSIFVVKQIALPENRLQKLDSFEVLLNQETQPNSSSIRLRWFDPLIAITAVASIVFLLWTME